ncbi:MAG: tetratricopeptide repeat protein [Spirochaetes bacterium]|nr:tetratricopeptide repeat protein [Spirochaetota bacterium]
MRTLFLSTITFFFFISCSRVHPPQSNDRDFDIQKIKHMLFEQERYAESISEIEKSLSKYNEDSTLFYLRGMAYLNTKQYEFAMNDFIAAMRMDPQNPLPYNGIGNIFYLKFEDHLAETFWTNGLARAKNPAERAMFLANLALLAMNEKKYDEALKLLEEAKKISPDGRYENLIGRVYVLMKNNKKAKEIWSNALANNTLPWAQYNFKHNTAFRLCELYLDEKNYKEAFQFCEMALLMYPASPDYQKLFIQLKQKLK